jgi:Xaa-Pro aminopeptidase
LLLLSFILHAQQDLPTDYLSPDFHKSRRDAARQLMPANSVMVVFAAPTRTFSNDVEYFYHQNPDLYYFTGYKEPHAVLFLFKESQTFKGNPVNEIFFVQKRNADAERWTGRRMGTEGVKSKLGITTVFNGEDFASQDIDFSKFDKIIFDNLPDDVVRGSDPGSLFRLMSTFKSKAGISEDYDAALNNYFDQVGNNESWMRFTQYQEGMKNRIRSNPKYASNTMITKFMDVKDSAAMVSFREELGKRKYSTSLFRQITGTLREVKTPEEMDLIRKAVEISCLAHNEVMKAVRADMSELEIQGLQEYIHKRYGAEGVGYGSIVGAGENGCILHYMENTKTHVGKDLILMDVGAEYHGYTADVTRTIPADGKFSPEERAIYQLVYDAQEAAFKLLKDGARWSEAGNAAREVIANGLLGLGIIKDKKDVTKYYPHGLSHHIGLDVHDKGVSQILKKDMVITIEPGIYIPNDSPCDKKWWGISVRIEDDALITQNGYELLSAFSPRSITDIEKMIAEKSVLDNYKLPVLKSGQQPKKAF